MRMAPSKQDKMKIKPATSNADISKPAPFSGSILIGPISQLKKAKQYINIRTRLQI